jgi:CheY-like chemotaxis protein/putative methionine-R-sulfoxide reductase with GAF domain
MTLIKQTDFNIHVAVVAVSLVVFCIDVITPLGFAVWILYILPVVICIFQTRPEVPYAVALAQTVLITIGYFASPSSISIYLSIANRTFGLIVIYGIAYIVSRAIKEHLMAQQALWVQKGKAEINKNILGEHDVASVANNMLRTVATYVGAKVGRFYRLEKDKLVTIAAFALDRPLHELSAIPVGQGLAGEVAHSGKPFVASNLPSGYIDVSSGLGRSSPQHLVISPITVEGHIYGVIELGFCSADRVFTNELELLRLAAEPTGSAMRAAQDREHLKELLEETQRQSEELQVQHEELRVSNEELEEQSRVLRESQTRLENQQAELEANNAQLEEQAETLERQKEELLHSKQRLERNAQELARANQYKSEFLANMSHELRTPLNSSLILSQILAENKTGTLTDEQVRYAKTIQSSNKALLALINDILDLSKIEAGHMDVELEQVSLDAVLDTLRQLFEPIAQEKKLSFSADAAPGTPSTFTTDNRRLLQILKNLLSNAFKFTHKGEVALRATPAGQGRIAFAVHDTGVGIPEHQQQLIFEAFRQADGTTSRMYGGTGLGLSISRELARLLRGEIHVKSVPDRGSTFTLEITTDLGAPVMQDNAERRSVLAYPPVPVEPAPKSTEEPINLVPGPAQVEDDRLKRERDRLILLIEDDPRFASILRELANERNFDCIHAPTAGNAIKLAQEYRPDGILLDIGLPDRSGLSVLESLKRDPATRHVPVHVVSLADHMQAAYELGAVGYALKPVAREELFAAINRLEDKLQNRVRRLLIIEDNLAQRESLVEMLKADDIQITVAATVAEALQRLSEATFDCVVTDLMLPDASGYDLLEKLAEGGKYAFPPVIVYTGRSLSREEEQRLRRYSQSIIIKSAKSPARLLDEVTLFLHRVESSLPPAQQQLLLQARQRDAAFENRRILLVEDDVRNIFALSSILEPLGVEVDIARNGREALDKLPTGKAVSDFDLVLMDLMMPEMDGLTAMREIRRRPGLTKLPIIALTAKAMPDDRRNCLEAGANDYIAKPIDIDKLVSLCRIWMPK